MKARHIALHFAGIAGIKNKGVVTLSATFSENVYFESTEITPNKDIRIFFYAATAKFRYSQGSKQWLIKISCY